MDIDIQTFIIPAALDSAAAEVVLAEAPSLDWRFRDGVDVMGFRVSIDDVAADEETDVDGPALRDHAERWVSSFTDLVQGRNRWFESRVAHRVPLRAGAHLLVVAFDLDGVHDAWYEDVFSLAVFHYAPIARAMGVRLPGEFALEAH